MNEATIGKYTWDGVEYEIDWPYDNDDDIADEDARADFGAIYRDGEQVGEVCAQLGERFESEDDVMEAAIAAIMAGEVDW